MQQCFDFEWCQDLAAHLAHMTASTRHNHPIMLHTTGVSFNVWEIGNTRRQLTPYNMRSADGNRMYPTLPPNPVTVDIRRPLPKIATELQRRLIDPALIWFTGANAWRTQDAAEQQRLAAIRRLFIGLGGTTPTHTEQIFGYDPYWTAQISSNGSVTLQIRSIDYEQALSIIESLQKGK